MSNSLTRQHFRALADAIASVDLGPEERATVARAVAVAVAPFNDRFDRSKFMDAATGQTPEPRPRRSRARVAVAAARADHPAGTMLDRLDPCGYGADPTDP
jgi:hypothetical protein